MKTEDMSDKRMMGLAGANCFLTPLYFEDRETMFSWINFREVVLNNSAYKPVHEVCHHKWFEDIVKRKDVRIFGIRDKTATKLIGSCQLMNIDLISRSAELQIRIAEKKNRGRGIGAESIRLLLKFAFGDLNLQRVFLQVFKDNESAIGCYTKNGFQIEGTLRKHSFIDGQYKDVLIMGILKEDFNG